MHVIDPLPPHAADPSAAMTISTNREVVLRIDGVSKTFSRAAKRRKSVRPHVSWHRRLSWRGLREGLTSRRSGREQKRVVDSITLSAHRGEALGILGPNGCGKSTLVRMISTLLIPDEGTIEVFGHDVVRDAREVKYLINRVSVDAAFFKKLSALENLLYTARLYDVPPSDALTKAGEILRLLGFDPEHLTNPMEQLSRGQQQKVAIARAFLTSPRLVLLDEPTTGLDPKSKKDVEAFIKELRASYDTTILLTTHDMAEAEALCDRVAILNRGKLVALGTAHELKAQFRKHGSETLPTLEEIFIEIAGKPFADADEHEGEDDDPVSPLLEETS